MGADSSLLSPIACASHSSGAPFWPVQRIQRIPHNHKEILAWCLHNDKAKGGTSKQPDKAPVSKERSGGRSPTQETLGIIRGGGSRALHPPTRLETHPPRPPPLLLSSYNIACFPLLCASCQSDMHNLPLSPCPNLHHRSDQQPDQEYQFADHCRSLSEQILPAPKCKIPAMACTRTAMLHGVPHFGLIHHIALMVCFNNKHTHGMFGKANEVSGRRK